MTIGTLIKNIGKVIGSRGKTGPEVPDDVTTDRYLRSLRRQRRIQQEEVEKIRLKKQIADYSRNRDRKYMWGFKDKQRIPQRNNSKKHKPKFFNKEKI